jgi:hypothetical protein
MFGHPQMRIMIGYSLQPVFTPQLNDDNRKQPPWSNLYFAIGTAHWNGPDQP